MLKEVQMNVAQDLPEASHFGSMQITNGVFTAFPKEGVRAISNTGVGDLGDQTLVFGRILPLKASEELRAT